MKIKEENNCKSISKKNTIRRIYFKFILFILAILQSFSNNKMYSYIFNLLSIKLEEHKNEEKKRKDVIYQNQEIIWIVYIFFIIN